MATTTERTIQEEVNFQNSAAGGNLFSMVISNKKGECTVPKNVSVRFYNCTFSSLKADSNNIYLKGCTLEGNSSNYFLSKSNIIIDRSTIKTKMTFSNSTVELLKNTIGTSLLAFTSVIKSLKNSWTSQPDGTETNNRYAIFGDKSRIISIKDTFEKWNDYIIKGTNKSFVKVHAPRKIDISSPSSSKSPLKGLLLLDNSTAILKALKSFPSIKDCTTPLFSLKNSSLILDIATEISTDYIQFEGKDSTIRIENGGKFTTKSIFASLVNCHLFLNNIASISTTGEDKLLFNAENSYITGQNVAEYKGISTLFNIKNTTVILKNSLTSSSIEGKNNYLFTVDGALSNVYLDKISSIVCTGSSVCSMKNGSSIYITNSEKIENKDQGEKFTLDNSNLYLSNITSITSKGSNIINAKNTSKVSLNLINELSNTEQRCIFLDSNSKCVSSNVKTIKGKTGGVSLESKSSFISSNVDNIEATSGDAITLGSNTFLSLNAKAIKGTGHAINTTGRNGKIQLNFIESISGDILIQDFDLIWAQKQLKGSILHIPEESNVQFTASEGTGFVLSLEGPIVFDSTVSIQNYKLTESNVTWNKNVTNTGSFIDGYNPTYTKNISGTDTVIRFVKGTTKDITVGEASIVQLHKTKAQAITLSDKSTLVGLSAQLTDISLADSAAEIAASVVSGISFSGKSTLLGLALPDVSVSFTSDPSITGVAFLTASGGNLGLQADNKIIEETDILEIKARTKIDESATTQILSTVGSSSINIAPTQINITSATLINIQADSTITLDAVTVNI